ncbi:MAG: amidohydrolase family protein [Bryobacteraceae bacterium]
MNRSQSMVKILRGVAAALVWSVLVHGEVPSAIAIKDAHVVTVSGPDLPKATVLLRDGLIEDVGPNLTVPADAWVIDGNGLTVYPGFIDGLSTWGIPQPAAAPPQPRTAATAVPAAPAPRPRGPEDRPQNNSYERAADLVKPSDARLEAAHAAGFTTSVTFPENGVIGGEGAVVNLAGERASDMVIATPAGQYVALRQAGFLAGYPNSLMGLISYVRQLYLDLDWYKSANSIYVQHVSGNVRPGYDHYLEGLAQSPRILFPADQAQQIDRMVKFGTELKQPYVLYGLHEAFRRVDELKQANIPLLISLKWPVKPKDADPANVPDYRVLEERDQAPAAPGLLAKAGVRFGFYDDGVPTGPDLRAAVKKAIDRGLPRAEAIRALTLTVAEMYSVGDRLGSIEKGKIANLTVTRGEAFEDGSKVEHVFIDGKDLKPRETPPQPAPPAGGAE